MRVQVKFKNGNGRLFNDRTTEMFDNKAAPLGL